MTDAEYLFKQDIREKKSANRGARAKVSGSKTKYCGLPSDSLTAAQLKRRNSPVYTYNISKCLSFDEFKRLPDDLKLQYLNTLSATYRVPLKTIAESMGCGKSTMSRYSELVGFHPTYSYRTPAPDDKWFDFVAGVLTAEGRPVGEQPQPETENELSVSNDAPTAATVDTHVPVPVHPTSGELVITCTQAELSSYLHTSIPANIVYEFSVRFKLVNEPKQDGTPSHSSLLRSDKEA